MNIRFKCKGENNYKDLGFLNKTQLKKLPKKEQNKYELVGYTKQPYTGDFINVYAKDKFKLKTLLNDKSFLLEEKKLKKYDIYN